MLSSLKCPFENIVDDGYYPDNAVNFCSVQKIFPQIEKQDIGHLSQKKKKINQFPSHPVYFSPRQHFH